MVKILQKIIIIIKVKKNQYFMCICYCIFLLIVKAFSYLKNYLIYSYIYEKFLYAYIKYKIINNIWCLYLSYINLIL